jgi:hypothetical protein
MREKYIFFKFFIIIDKPGENLTLQMLLLVLLQILLKLMEVGRCARRQFYCIQFVSTLLWFQPTLMNWSLYYITDKGLSLNFIIICLFNLGFRIGIGLLTLADVDSDSPTASNLCQHFFDSNPLSWTKVCIKLKITKQFFIIDSLANIFPRQFGLTYWPRHAPSIPTTGLVEIFITIMNNEFRLWLDSNPGTLVPFQT